MLQVVSVVATASTSLSNLGNTYVSLFCLSSLIPLPLPLSLSLSNPTSSCQFGAVFTLGCGQNVYPVRVPGCHIIYKHFSHVARFALLCSTVIASDPLATLGSQFPPTLAPCALPNEPKCLFDVIRRRQTGSEPKNCLNK